MKKNRSLRTLPRSRYAINTIYVAPQNPYLYHIQRLDQPFLVGMVQFQQGFRDQETNIPGIMEMDLLRIVEDRFRTILETDRMDSFLEKALTSVQTAISALEAMDVYYNIQKHRES